MHLIQERCLYGLYKEREALYKELKYDETARIAAHFHITCALVGRWLHQDMFYKDDYCDSHEWYRFVLSSLRSELKQNIYFEDQAIIFDNLDYKILDLLKDALSQLTVDSKGI